MSARNLLRGAVVALIVAAVATFASLLHDSADGLGTVVWLLSMLSAVVAVLLLVAAGLVKLAGSRVDPR